MNTKKQGIRFTGKQMGFALYDFANSSYVLIFLAYLFPLYFKANVRLMDVRPEVVWSIVLSVSIAIALLISVSVGRKADTQGRLYVLKRLIIGVVGGILILFLIPSDFQYYSFILIAIFLMMNVLFTVSLGVYDSLINHVAVPSERHEVSGFAWGMGYVGGVVCLILVVLAQKYYPDATRLGFGITGAFFACFSFLSIYLMQRPVNTISSGYSEIKEPRIVDADNTTIGIRQFFTKAGIMSFVLGVWFISEGIDIVIYFTSLYAESEFGLDTLTIGKLLLLVQLLAFPLTWIITRNVRRLGIKRVLNATLVIWVVVVIGMILSQSIIHLVVFTVLTSFVIGSTQSILRGEYSRYIPDVRSGEHFGLFSILTRMANILGPLIFGGLLFVSDSMRIAMSVVILLFLAGIFFINKFYRSGQN